ncbi:HAD-IA family hydrolase [Alkalimonas collagenimarina]|uniref:HAD-IA family hydrolase n=1 Tax=Alkalimonas collagenimarina TaxID=400390 RepID=A0ABT9H352_9GAMM|nr:HAD-IA family hydrolase [Alkalimonas collagenimarina]MDP4537325.1 HAD-IA family hydrolase [Alkalimonas collagenimarina]
MQHSLQCCRLVIFDWDGTVMDSVGRIVSAMQTSAKLAELPVPTAYEVKQIIGLSLDLAFTSLFPCMNKQQHQSLFKHYREQYVHHDPTPTPMFEGAELLFQQLHQQQRQLAVATGKARKGLTRIFAETGLAHYFVTTRCADDARSKPDPDMLLQILHETGLQPEQAVMVGDTSHDMLMAQKAGIPRIGVTHGVHGLDVLAKFEPIAIVDDLHQLKTLFSSS